jgi:hypothetical protein
MGQKGEKKNSRMKSNPRKKKRIYIYSTHAQKRALLLC